MLHIGRNDRGVVVGVPDAARLLEEIPNKTRDILGIIVEVNLREEGGKEWLDIAVEPYPYPVSYKGEYHLRSGSTKQELKGAALDKFLLRKQGRTWDAVPVPQVKVSDLSKAAVDGFRKLARQSRRLDTSVLREPAAGLLEKLNLMDGTHLKRAAVLLYHRDPERLITGAFLKIGYFRSEADLLYHDEVHGDLFTQTQKAMELLLTKYLKAGISYRGIHRVESLPVPKTRCAKPCSTRSFIGITRWARRSRFASMRIASRSGILVNCRSGGPWASWWDRTRRVHTIRMWRMPFSVPGRSRHGGGAFSASTTPAARRERPHLKSSMNPETCGSSFRFLRPIWRSSRLRCPAVMGWVMGWVMMRRAGFFGSSELGQRAASRNLPAS